VEAGNVRFFLWAPEAVGTPPSAFGCAAPDWQRGGPRRGVLAKREMDIGWVVWLGLGRSFRLAGASPRFLAQRPKRGTD
jgi:hypothetical protein